MRRLDLGDRPCQVLGSRQGHAKGVMRARVLRHKPDSLLKFTYGLRRLPFREVRPSQLEVGIGHVRLRFENRAELRDGFVQLVIEEQCHPVMVSG